MQVSVVCCDMPCHDEDMILFNEFWDTYQPKWALAAKSLSPKGVARAFKMSQATLSYRSSPTSCHLVADSIDGSRPEDRILAGHLRVAAKKYIIRWHECKVLESEYTKLKHGHTVRENHDEQAGAGLAT